MSSFVRAGMLALAIIHNASSVRAITLRTLLENQLEAQNQLNSEVTTESQIEEQAVMKLVSDIKELSFTQVMSDDGGTEEDQTATDYSETNRLLQKMAEDGMLDTLKQAMYDVNNGIYETSKAAGLATGTLHLEDPTDGMQAGQVLISQDNTLLSAGETITGADGQVVDVQTEQPEDTAAVDQASTDVVQVDAAVQPADPAAPAPAEGTNPDAAADDVTQASIPDNTDAAGTADETEVAQTSDEVVNENQDETTAETPQADAPDDCEGGGFLGVFGSC